MMNYFIAALLNVALKSIEFTSFVTTNSTNSHDARNSVKLMAYAERPGLHLAYQERLTNVRLCDWRESCTA